MTMIWIKSKRRRKRKEGEEKERTKKHAIPSKIYAVDLSIIPTTDSVPFSKRLRIWLSTEGSISTGGPSVIRMVPPTPRLPTRQLLFDEESGETDS